MTGKGDWWRKLIEAFISIGLVTLILTVLAISEYVEIRTVIQSRSSDTMITSVVTVTDSRDEHLEEALIDLVNPSASPVLVGLSVRKTVWPSWFRPQQTAWVISRPGLPRYGVVAQSTIGVIPANGSSRLAVRIPSGRRRCRVVAIAGEADGRLRAMSVRIPTRSFVPLKPSSARADPDWVSDVGLDGLFFWFI